MKTNLFAVFQKVLFSENKILIFSLRPGPGREGEFCNFFPK